MKTFNWNTIVPLMLAVALGLGSCYSHRSEEDRGSGVKLDERGPDPAAPEIDLDKPQDPKEGGGGDTDEGGSCDECEVNSGYPCPCNAVCGDGSACAGVESASGSGIRRRVRSRQPSR